MGIGYVSKVGRYMRILGLPEFTVEPEAPLETFRRTFDRLWTDRDRIARGLRAKNQELRALSDENVRIIREVLREKRRDTA